MDVTGLDCETALATNDEPVPRLVSVAFATCDAGVELYVAHDPALPQRLDKALQGTLACANAPFDAYVLWRAFPWSFLPFLRAYGDDRVADVLTREKLIDIANGARTRATRYNLGAVAHRRAGMAIDKNDPWRTRYAELLGRELSDWPPEARLYAEKDAAAHLVVYLQQESFRRAHLPLDVFANAPDQARGHLALYAHTLRGMSTDAKRVEALDRKLAREVEDAERRCLEAGLARIGGTRKKPKIVRTKAAAQALLEQWAQETGAPLHRTDATAQFPSGQISLSDEALRAANVPDDHPLAAYRALGSLGSKRSKNIPILRRPVVRTVYDELVDSGRTSSRKPQGKKAIDQVEAWEWVGSNFQNLDRKTGFRECLVPATCL